MVVSELIKELQKLDPDDTVLVARDSEGNGFSELEYVDVESAFRYIDYECEVRLRELTAELEMQGYTEEDIADEDFSNCVVLWP